jgi:L-amino acid N-acyltransferase YncA
MRKKGVATKLLERVCADATVDGYEYVEAYPYCHGQANNFHGSLSMYEKMGFIKTGQNMDDCVVLRKKLNSKVLS